MVKRRWQGVGMGLLATMLLAGSAFAQGRGGFGGGFGGGMLLRVPAVQEELKLTEEQKTKVAEMLNRLREERRGQFSQFRDLSREEREKQLAERRAGEEKQLQAILNTDQLKRYRQLQLQRQGLTTLRDATVQAELKLTEDQRSKVETILQEQAQEMRTLRQSARGGDRAAARSQMAEIRRKTDEKLMAVLTEDQKRQWKELLGPPFQFPNPPARSVRDSDSA